MGPHSSKFPCGWCFGKAPFLEKAELRTLGQLKKWAAEFAAEYGGDKKFAKDCFNCLNPSLLEGPDNTLVLETCPVDELHILLGKFKVGRLFSVKLSILTMQYLARNLHLMLSPVTLVFSLHLL